MSESGAPGGFGGGGGGFGGGARGPRREFDRGGARGRDGDREPRGPMSVKARLRAKARKKARKAAKKKGTSLRKKVCRFCAEPRTGIDYKDPKGLRYFVTETGKLIPSRISGNCAKHQREISVAIKRARHLALLPFASQHAG
jgi:small subunit ribosomal protein S18